MITLPLPDRRDDSLERWCATTWQTHEARARHPDYREVWPSTTTFKTNWPKLASRLIVAAWKIDRAHSPLEREEIDYELLDPSPRQRRNWRQIYAEELAESPRLAWALADEHPISAVILRARLSPLEADAFRLWAAGASLSSTARVMGRQKRAVKMFLERADFKIRELIIEIEEEAAS